jgi:uncharacterized protein YebE (UPF0316 family)
MATGILIFCARVCDVSIGTVRTIVTVQGRSVIAFFLSIIELITNRTNFFDGFGC